MIIKSILHAREQAQRKVCAPSKHQECLNQRHREVPVHHLHFLFCPYSLGPWLRVPHPWEIAFLFLSLYWIYYNIASVLCFEFFGLEACGILAPWLGIEPTPLALGGKVLTSGLSGKSSFFFSGPGILTRGAKWWPRKCVLWVYPESHSGA